MAHFGEGNATPPVTAARPVGDLTHPARVGRATHVVNGVSRDVSMDVADWRFERALSYYASLETEQRGGPHE